ncbi:hypothetical protein ACK1KB_02980 [Chryseobacterium sp. TY3]
MENIFLNYCKFLIDSVNYIQNQKTKFQNSKFFLICSLIIIPSTFFYFTCIFYEGSLLAGTLFLVLALLTQSILIPPIYCHVVGKDFFQILKEKFEPKAIINFEINKKKVEAFGKRPTNASSKIIDLLHMILRDSHAFDITKLSDEDQFKYADKFTKGYLEYFVNSVFQKTPCELYLTLPQNKVAYLLHKVIKHVLEQNVKDFSERVYYYKSKGFLQINYDCTTSTTNQREIKSIAPKIAELKKLCCENN